jgi:hypothetical protein
MRIVLSYHQLNGFGGTETYLLTVAGALERLGHDVLVHTYEAGRCAEFARAHGTRVVDREAELPTSCDALFAQDTATAYTLAARYPGAARVFVAHSTSQPLQSPPQLEEVCDAVVVMNDRLQRRVEALAWHPTVVRLRQPIDLQRFCFRALERRQRRPPRVVWLNNYGADARRRLLEQACQKAGLELMLVGDPVGVTATPEHVIANAEIVMSLGRGALEAMASGRAAYVFGVAGVDGWVTASSYQHLESDGFSGRAFGKAVGTEQLFDDLSSWSEEMGEVGRDLACRNHDADEHAVDLVQLIERADGQHDPPPPKAAGELARLVRIEWDRNCQARGEAAEAARARAEASAALAKSVDLQRHLAEVQAEADVTSAAATTARAEADALRGEVASARAHVADLEHAMSELQAQSDVATAEVARSQAAADEARESAAAAEARAADLERALAQLEASTRYRVGSLVAAPLDAIRARRR